MNEKPASIAQICRYIFSKRQRRYLAGLVLLLFFAALLETAVTALMLPFMNTIMVPDSISQSAYRRIIYQVFNCQNSTDFLVVMAVLLAVVYIAKGIFTLFSTSIQQTFLAKTQANISSRLFDCYLKKSYAYHLHKNSAEIQKNVTHDVSMLLTAIQSALSFFAESLVAICMLAMLLSYNPLLTLVAAVLVLVCLISVNLLVSKRIRRVSRKLHASSKNMYKSCAQALGGLKSMKVTHSEQLFVNDYAQNVADYSNMHKKYIILSTIPRTAVESISMAGIFLFMALLVRRGTQLDTMLPLFATFALAAVRLMPCATRIVAAYNGLLFNGIALRNIYEALRESGIDMQTETEVAGPVLPLVPTSPLTQGIELRHLSFRYGDAADDLFTDVNLLLPAQRSTAFVGVTGSGKTTLADLILGLHTPTSGGIFADGHDIHKEPDWWARRVGYVPQNIYLCDDTIAANVAFGRDVQNTDPDRVWHCLEQAQIKEFVIGLPDGLNTMVGEQGIRLSGGQRQRIGIARALYTDPQLLVMDEATSALDMDTEQAIIDSINKLAGQKTLLIIAHRLTTIKDCDFVYRVEDGTVTRER